MILRTVAALSEATKTAIVPNAGGKSRGYPLLAVIGEDLSTSRSQLFPMLLEAVQHGEIALIQDWTAIPLNVAGARALLLFGSTVLRHCGTGEKERQSGGNY